MGSRRGGRRRQGRAERDAGVGTGNHRIRIENLAMARVSKLGANTKDRVDQIEMEVDIGAEPRRRAPAAEEAGGKPEAVAAERQHRAKEGNERGLVCGCEEKGASEVVAEPGQGFDPSQAKPTRSVGPGPTGPSGFGPTSPIGLV
jgi:hypothetical protein